MNATKTALIAGAGVLGVAAVAGLGWRCLKSRNKAKAVEPVAAVPVVPPVTKKPETVEVKELSTLSLRKAGDPVLSAVADMMDNNWNLGNHPVTEEAVVEEVVTEAVVAPNDKVEEIQDGEGQPLVSVSRVRVPNQSTEAEPDMTPVFWKNFLANIKRPDVIAVESKSDFAVHDTKRAKGFHRCTLDGVEGVLHVTKSHTTALIHLGGTEFSGISTSSSRFQGKGLRNLNADQAKNFLAGR